MVLSLPLMSYGQSEEGPVIDKIVAKVDNYIILLSDIEFAYLDLASRGALVGDDPKCRILESVITQKLLLAIAEIDSVEVPDIQVDAELASRMQYFISQSGGDVGALEEYYGKSIDQIQAEMRDDMKEQMVSQKMRSVISDEVTITPSEIRKFFNRIPKDSLPYFSEEVEVAQIVKTARVGREQKLKVETQLNDIKSSIEDGANFGTMAEMYSMDPGSAKTGGELPGWYKRGQLAPEYEAAIFKLKTGEISSPVETDFGFHLIQVLERRGNEFRTRHILITPNSSDLDIDYTVQQLDSVRSLIVDGKQEFEKVAKDFSDDKMSAPSGGFFLNNNGATSIAVDQLDPTVYFMLDTMAVGSVTAPVQFRMPTGKEAVRIIYYKSKVSPHQANLEQDWQKIQEAALNEKKSLAEAKWVIESKGKVFIYVDDEFKHCQLFER
ncbi:MAG: peptidylprolyl isomerase [Bacteroidetes bacterium]|nr:MAG: peptidylprolyl isomerase [Bacteroidota bacterium]